jgi:hypothetical protein
MTHNASKSHQAPRRTIKRLGTIATAVPWYPVVLALVWFVHLYQVAHVEPSAAARSFIVFTGVAAVVTLACVWMLGTERGACWRPSS